MKANKHRGPRRRPLARGVAMMLVMIGITVAFIMGAAFLSAQETATGLLGNMGKMERARLIAESTLAAALRSAKTDSNWRTAFAGWGAGASGAYDGGTYVIKAEDGRYLDGVLTGDGDLLDDSAEVATLTVTATYGNTTHTARAVITPTAAPASPGIVATEKFTMSNYGLVDSYNAAAGAYGGSNVGSNAVVASNSTGILSALFSTYAQLKGQLKIGPGGDPASAVSVSSGASITGGVSNLSAAETFTIPAIPGGISDSGLGLYLGPATWNSNKNFSIALGVFDTITINGNVTVVCGPLAVWFGKFKINPNSSLTMYLTGGASIALDGDINTDSSRPNSVVIYNTTSDEIRLETPGSYVSANILSPQGRVVVTSGGVHYGTIKAKEVEVIVDGQVHCHSTSSGATTYTFAWDEQP